MLRRAFMLALTLVAVQALAQDVKRPKIEPTDFKDPGPVALKFIKGQSESYITTSATKTVVGVEVAGQEMTITTKGNIRSRSVYTPLDDAVPTKLEIVTDRIKGTQTVDNPMMAMEITFDNEKIKATSGGQVVYDSEKGGENAMAEQFTQGIKHLGKKATVVVDANGVAGKTIEGDPEAVKNLRELVGQGLFPVHWKAQTGLKVGDTWVVETEMRSMQNMTLKQPIKLKTSYKVLGAVLLDGVPCIDLEVVSAAKGSDIESDMEQGGMQIKLKIASISMSFKGHAYYDAAKGRVVYADSKGAVEFDAAGDVQGAGQITMKVAADIATITQHNAPW